MIQTSLGDEAQGCSVLKTKPTILSVLKGEGISKGARAAWQRLSACRAWQYFPNTTRQLLLFILPLSYFSFVACTNINCFG